MNLSSKKNISFNSIVDQQEYAAITTGLSALNFQFYSRLTFSYAKAKGAYEILLSILY